MSAPEFEFDLADFEICPKCGRKALGIVDVLDANDEPLGQSLHCIRCHWLEEDEWPNIVE